MLAEGCPKVYRLRWGCPQICERDGSGLWMTSPISFKQMSILYGTISFNVFWTNIWIKPVHTKFTNHKWRPLKAKSHGRFAKITLSSRQPFPRECVGPKWHVRIGRWENPHLFPPEMYVVYRPRTPIDRFFCWLRGLTKVAKSLYMIELLEKNTWSLIN